MKKEEKKKAPEGGLSSSNDKSLRLSIHFKTCNFQYSYPEWSISKIEYYGGKAQGYPHLKVKPQSAKSDKFFMIV